MHVGGVQEAMIAAPPGCAAETVAALLGVAGTVTTAASEVLQVSGTFVSVTSWLSTTVAVTSFEPLDMLNELVADPVTARVIDCTGQVVKVIAGLFTPAAVTKNPVTPGILAVACT